MYTLLMIRWSPKENSQHQRLIPTVFSVFKDFDAPLRTDWMLYCFLIRIIRTSTASNWIIRYNYSCFRDLLKCDGTRAETRFRLSAKLTSPFKSAGGRQFSWLLAAEVCASALVMLDTPCCEVVWRVLATHFIRRFPLHFPSGASQCAITFQLESTFEVFFCFVFVSRQSESKVKYRILCYHQCDVNSFVSVRPRGGTLQTRLTLHATCKLPNLSISFFWNGTPLWCWLVRDTNK